MCVLMRVYTHYVKNFLQVNDANNVYVCRGGCVSQYEESIFQMIYALKRFKFFFIFYSPGCGMCACILVCVCSISKRTLCHPCKDMVFVYV